MSLTWSSLDWQTRLGPCRPQSLPSSTSNLEHLSFRSTNTLHPLYNPGDSREPSAPRLTLYLLCGREERKKKSSTRLMFDGSCLILLNPSLSLPSRWDKAILEVSVWGEICQLFSNTLHHNPEKRESSGDRSLQGLGLGSQAWILFLFARASTVVLHHVGALIHLSGKPLPLAGQWNARVPPEASGDGRCAAEWQFIVKIFLSRESLHVLWICCYPPVRA